MTLDTSKKVTSLSSEPTKDESTKDEANELLDKMNKKLADVGGESNVGVTDEYWDWLRQYRKLTTK